MAEETSTTGPGGASKTPTNSGFGGSYTAGSGSKGPAQPPATAADAPVSDVRIVEEVITKPHKVPASEVQKLQTLQPQRAAVIPPPAARPPQEKSPPPPVIPPFVSKPFVTPTPIIQNIPAPPAAPTPQPPRPPAPTLPPEPSPTRDTMVPASGGSDVKTDVSQLLKSVRLPDRHDTTPSASAKIYEVKTFDTALSADVKLEQEKTREEAAVRAAIPTSQTPPAPKEPRVTEDADPNAYKPPEADTQKKSTVVPVHTLKDDLQQVVHDQKISVVRAVSLEENRKYRGGAEGPSETPARQQRSKRTFAIMFSVILLIILGAGAMFGIYSVEQARSVPSGAPSTSSILFAESSIAFPLGNQSPNALKQVLAQARTSSGGALGSVTQIVPTLSTTASDGTVTMRPATFEEFMKALGSDPPPDLIRALSSDFFFGIHTVDKNAPLIIVPIISYDHAFAGMLEWEPTLNADLAPVFTGVPAQMTDTSGLPVMRGFSDIVMRNYDVRALKDDSGQIVMYYSFPTQKILIIAESPYTFTETLSRLQAQRKL